MSNLRVISGTARGRRLKSVPGDITRPITDRVKESLFNILGPDIQDSVVLDLFAGTGSVGIEALSRGAAHVCFNDRHRMAVKTVKENLEITGLEAKAEILQMDAFTLLERDPDRKYDYIFIAPPQYKQIWVKALQFLDRNPGWVGNDAWVIVQIDPLELEPVTLRTLVEFDRRRYGNTLLCFYSKPDLEDE